MALTARGLDGICRLCAIESESGVTIYSHEGENLSLEQKIINCLRIEVSQNDLLPKMVCSTCNALLEELHQFICRAANAQQTLNFLFDLQLRQLQEQELSLLQNVKTEGSLIKNELDDLTVHHPDLRVDRVEPPSSDVNFSQLDVLHSENQVRCSNTLLHYNQQTNEKEKIAPSNLYHDGSDSTVKSTETGVLLEQEPRHGHRRKMFQPKKTSERHDKPFEEVDLVDNDTTGQMLGDTPDIECLALRNDRVLEDDDILAQSTVKEDFKPVDFDDEELFEDIEDETTAREENRAHRGTTSRDWDIACAKCTQVFPRRAEFEKHYKDAHGEKPIYTCSQCGKSIPKFSTFRSHCYRHDSKFPCIYCDKVFTLEGVLRVHVLSRHVTVRPFICETCGKGYVTQYRLNTHQKQHQRGEKEFRCTQCNKVLQTRNGLSAHMTVHRFGRRFMCHLCGKTFTQKVNMQQHVKYHKGERPFKCDQCNKTFAEKSHLNRHKSFHTLERPFQCTVCLKMYKTERCLKVHSQVHQVTRPYVCSECGKGFLNVTKLKQHYHCHTGERPYACKYCERTFTNYPNWLKHTRRRHKVDHKTGVKLKEEVEAAQQVQAPLQRTESLDEMELFDMAEVKVKEDHLLGDATQSILTQFHVSADLSQFQLEDQPLIHYTDHSHMLLL